MHSSVVPQPDYNFRNKPGTKTTGAHGEQRNEHRTEDGRRTSEVKRDVTMKRQGFCDNGVDCSGHGSPQRACPAHGLYIVWLFVNAASTNYRTVH